MQLSFLGASGEVTGSNYLLEIGNKKVLIDCGAFQGGKDQELKNVAPFLYDPKSIDALVLTHAHLDHVGRVGKLVRDGFDGSIYATAPTRDIAEQIMLDAVSIMAHDELKFGKEPIYRQEDVKQAMALFKDLGYHQKIEILPDIEISLLDAGHILGSASVEVWAEGKKIIFSGDIGNAGAPIIRDPELPTEANYLITESTYAGRTHEPVSERQKILVDALNYSIARNGVLLIPAFSLERSQEILHDLNHLIEEKIARKIPIFLDSPLAIKITKIFSKYTDYYDKEARAHLVTDDDFYHLPNLKMTLTTEESKAINNIAPPKVIIAGAGMLTGGRMMHHLRRYISKENTLLLFVGYQAKGTLGRRIRDGVKTIDLFHEEHKVRAKIMSAGTFSAHADHKQLMNWVQSVKTPPQRVFCTHGDPEALKNLHDAVQTKLGIDTIIPRFGQRFEL